MDITNQSGYCRNAVLAFFSSFLSGLVKNITIHHKNAYIFVIITKVSEDKTAHK